LAWQASKSVTAFKQSGFGRAALPSTAVGMYGLCFSQYVASAVFTQ